VAILNFAVTAGVAGIELQTVGVILMVIGGLSLVLTLGSAMSWPRQQLAAGRTLPGSPRTG